MEGQDIQLLVMQIQCVIGTHDPKAKHLAYHCQLVAKQVLGKFCWIWTLIQDQCKYYRKSDLWYPAYAWSCYRLGVLRFAVKTTRICALGMCAYLWHRAVHLLQHVFHCAGVHLCHCFALCKSYCLWRFLCRTKYQGCRLVHGTQWLDHWAGMVDPTPQHCTDLPHWMVVQELYDVEQNSISITERTTYFQVMHTKTLMIVRPHHYNCIESFRYTSIYCLSIWSAVAAVWHWQRLTACLAYSCYLQTETQKCWTC